MNDWPHKNVPFGLDPPEGPTSVDFRGVPAQGGMLTLSVVRVDFQATHPCPCVVGLARTNWFQTPAGIRPWSAGVRGAGLVRFRHHLAPAPTTGLAPRPP